MLTYLLNLTLTWLVLMFLYKLLLEQEKFFKINRLYLLSALTLGLVLPLMSYVQLYSDGQVSEVIPQINQYYQAQVDNLELWTSSTNSPATATLVSESNSSWDWRSTLMILYLSGLVVVLLKFAVSLYQLAVKLKGAAVVKRSTHYEVTTISDVLPFSFFKFVFTGGSSYSITERDRILDHELHHVRSWHSVDIILIEMIKIIFWWNPLVYIFQSAITQNHEFAADDAVIASSSRKQYCSMLLKATFPEVNLQLTNPFFKSFTKKRISMMYQKQSRKIDILKYGVSFVAVAILSVLFGKPATSQYTPELVLNPAVSMETETTTYEKTANDVSEIASIQQIETLAPTNINNKLTVMKEVDFNNYEENPKCLKTDEGVYYLTDLAARLPDCPEELDASTHARVGLANYFSSRFVMPDEAIRNGFNGSVFATVFIDKNGNIERFTEANMKPVPAYLRKEVSALLSEMKSTFTFKPAECQGTKVPSLLNLAFRIKVPESKSGQIEVRDASSVKAVQVISIQNMGVNEGKGYLSYYYRSNMNVPTTIKVENPKGETVYEEAFETMFEKIYLAAEIKDRINGQYVVTATQDGRSVSSSIDCTVY